MGIVQKKITFKANEKYRYGLQKLDRNTLSSPGIQKLKMPNYM